MAKKQKEEAAAAEPIAAVKAKSKHPTWYSTLAVSTPAGRLLFNTLRTSAVSNFGDDEAEDKKPEYRYQLRWDNYDELVEEQAEAVKEFEQHCRDFAASALPKVKYDSTKIRPALWQKENDETGQVHWQVNGKITDYGDTKAPELMRLVDGGGFDKVAKDDERFIYDGAQVSVCGQLKLTKSGAVYYMTLVPEVVIHMADGERFGAVPRQLPKMAACGIKEAPKGKEAPAKAAEPEGVDELDTDEEI